MPESRSTRALEGAIQDILKLAQQRSRTPSVRSGEAYVRDVVELDYGAAVKKHFDAQQLKKMLRELRRALPTLNDEAYTITQVGDLSRQAAGLGVLLQAKPLRGSHAAGLRGFYVSQAEVLKRPLIWVNSANHPTAMAASFWHEVGHHLSNQIWGTHQQPDSVSFGAHYRDDLENPKEIAADMVRVLAGYPRATAQRLFGGSDVSALSRDANRLVAVARPHMRSMMGFDFQSRFSPRENLFYLGGIIHVAKLRTTLLSEYGI